jgi:protein-arginine kinase activator protein McsA
MLLLHYEKQEDYTRAANVFKQIKSLEDKNNPGRDI